MPDFARSSRRSAIAALFVVPAALAVGLTRAGAADDAPILLGVSGPLTGQNARYGPQWREGFDLALDDINGKGGIKGRPLRNQFEDSRADPRRTVAIAQGFVSDPKIVVELGDFSSTASMASSSILQRAGLVQFGFTNSHPNFTKGGDNIWWSSVSQADEQPRLAKYAADLGFKRLAVLYLNTDWGRTSQTLFSAAAKALGAEVVTEEGYQPDEKDFRPSLVRARDANPDAIVLISYYADGALITRQIRTVGLKTPIVASGSIYSPNFLEFAGDAANGVFTETNFFPGESRPEGQNFVSKFRARYNEDPDTFNAVAYDTIVLFGQVFEQFETERAGVRDGLVKIKNVPSDIFGKPIFDPETRRVAGARAVYLVVKDGKFAPWAGGKSPAN